MLMHAFLNGKIGHGGNSPCAVTHILGGKRDWIDVIQPSRGTIDHKLKLSDPTRFAKGLQLINESAYTIEEIIYLEAQFCGREKDSSGRLMSTWDETNDPDGAIGLEAVLEGLQQLKKKNLSYSKVEKVVA